MKTLARCAVLAAWLVLALLPSPVHAQGGNGGSVSIFLPPSIYYQPVTGGTFTDNGDGTYNLTLDGVALEMLRFENTPSLQMHRVDTGGFATSWALAPDLATQAVLDAEGLQINLTLSAPAYDGPNATLAFRAVVDQIAALQASKDKPELPATFGSAHLSIAATSDFQIARAAAIINVTEGMRSVSDLGASCEAVGVTLEEDSTSWQSLMGEAHTAAQDCQNGKAASCNHLQEVNGSMQQVQGELGDAIDTYSRDCRTWAMPHS